MKNEALEAAYLAGFNASGEGYNGEYGIDCPEENAIWKKDRDKAITVIKQARALDKMAENARELGLDYEPAPVQPVAWLENLKRLASICPELNMVNYSEEDVDDLNCWAIEVSTCIDSITTPPAPVQPVAWLYPEGLEALKAGKCWTAYGTKQDDNCNILVYLAAVAPKVEPVKTECDGFDSHPAAQPAPVQPAETSAERTLQHLGYTDNGGEFWKPPLGKPAPDLQAELDATNKQVEILSDALAESRREVAALKPVQEPSNYNEFVETACALIKAADDAAADRDYMLDSDDCIAVLRGTWKAPLANDMPKQPTPTAQPAPVQEPVAWMAESKNGNVRFTNIGQSADQLESFGWTIFPLYAAPFQFQPLTEEAVLECWKQVYEPGRREYDNATRMARAIEAAHGITAAPEKGN